MTTDILAHIAQSVAWLAVIAGVFVLIIYLFGDKPPKAGGH